MGKKTVSEDKKVLVKSLVDAGLNYRRVSDITGVSPAYIVKIVREFESNREFVEWYKRNRTAILQKAQMDNLALQEAIRDSVTEEELRKWTPDQRARWYQVLGTDYGIKYDKERLERGESTENVSIIVGAIMELKRKRQRQLSQEEETEN